VPVLTGGPLVDAIWRRLLDRAGPRPAVPTTDDPDLHLLVDGRRVDVASCSDVWHVYRAHRLPHRRAAGDGASARSTMPRRGAAADHGNEGAQIRTIEAADALLSDGFHEYESDNDIRWTDGDAGAPAGLFEGFAGPLEIAVRLGGRTWCLDEGTLPRVA
jgi:hypothetical protein